MNDSRVPLSRRTFVYGAAILAVAGIVIKIIGFAFRIPLGNMIGDDGMGYYSAVYPLYTLLVVIATTGIPIAISRLVSEAIADDDYGAAGKVFKTAFVLMAAVGVCFFAVLFFGAPAITGSIKNLSGSVHAMKAIAPALLFVPIMATIRGYFQGHQNMKPTALSQIIEQAFRVLFGLVIAYALIGKGLEYAAAGGTFGATAGAAAGFVTLGIIYFKTQKTATYRDRRERLKKEQESSKNESTRQVLKKILVIALPIIAGAAIMSVMYLIDLWVVPARLSVAGFIPDDVVRMYGQLTGFAEPLMNLPKVLTQAIAISMVPAIVSAWKNKDRELLHYNISLGLRIAFIIGLPCTVGLMILAEPVMFLLYPLQASGAEGAAPAMFIFAIGIVFLTSIDALTSTLQGVGKQMIPFFNIIIGAGCKLIITFVLTGVHDINIKGAATGTVVAYAVATILNYRAVVIYTGVRYDPGITFLRPIISAAAMGGSAAAVYSGIQRALIGSTSSFAENAVAQLHLKMSSLMAVNAVGTILAILVGAVVYIIMLFLTKSIKGEELRLLPKGEKLYQLYKKITKKFIRAKG